MTVTGTSTMSGTTTPSQSSASVAATRRGLTGGQIAGIVVGAVLGALVLLALLIGACLLLRRRGNGSQAASFVDQSAAGHPPPMAYHDGARDQQRDAFGALPSGRVARMAALEGSTSPDRHQAAYAPLGAYRKSSSDDDRTRSAHPLGLVPPPRRSGSLSSTSQLGMAAARGSGEPPDHTSPSSQTNDDTTTTTSPESQAPSEQLQSFKDYYSQDEIHTADLVSTLWAYEPRAADEFALERGDMIKVLGIWDDGWATGVRVRRKAEDWRPEDKVQRDSGVSNGTSSRPEDGEGGGGEVKAFPLVCVCLPQHWRRTIEGDSTEGSGTRP